VSLWLDGVRVEFAHSIQLEDRMSAVGGGSCVIPAVAPEALAVGAVVEVREFGATTGVAQVVSVERESVSGGEEGDDEWRYGLLSIAHELTRALVLPDRGFVVVEGGPFDGFTLGSAPAGDVRVFSSASTWVDRGSWPFAANLGPVWDRVDDVEGYPRLDTPRIGPSSSTEGDRWQVAVESEVAVGHHDVFVVLPPGNTADVWVDGALSVRVEGDSERTRRARVEFSGGEHTFVVDVEVGADATESWVALDVFPAWPTRDMLAPILSTSTSWGYLAPGAARPKWTPGAVVSRLFAEAQARGGLLDWTLGFDGVEDSAGHAWDEADQISIPCGVSIVEALAKLTDAWIEWGTDPTTNGGRHLLCFQSPAAGGVGRGVASGVELAYGAASDAPLLSMRHTIDEPTVSTVFGRWAGGWYELPFDVDPPRREGFLSLPQVDDGVAVFWDAAGTAGALSQERRAAEGVMIRLTEGVGVGVGDTITAPDIDMVAASWRVLGRAVSTDEDGNGRLTFTLGVMRDTLEQRTDRVLRRTIGTLDGQAEGAVASSPDVIESRTSSVAGFTFSIGGGTTIEGDRGSPERPRQLVLLTHVDVECDVAGVSGATSIAVELNGVPIGLATLPSGDEFARAQLDPPVVVSVLDWLNVETVSAGGHQGVSVRLVGVAAAE